MSTACVAIDAYVPSNSYMCYIMSSFHLTQLKTEKTRQAGLLTQAKDERDKYKATINDMLQHESKDALAREYSLLATQYGASLPRLSAASASMADRYSLSHRSPGRDVRFATSNVEDSGSRGGGTSTYPQSKLVSTSNHERAVERDLEMLDEEIGMWHVDLNFSQYGNFFFTNYICLSGAGDLRRRLEVAAVSQTKNMVSEVIAHAAVSI